ncbi:uncharacterized protein LOC143017586 [Oratosquilla oratoria]|uniref:uncharacterized protein LOC143017586 n=1 Tax=Oratosquilla oratoria TaxID=337810 RepID=UPI003F76E74D
MVRSMIKGSVIANMTVRINGSETQTPDNVTEAVEEVKTTLTDYAETNQFTPYELDPDRIHVKPIDPDDDDVNAPKYKEGKYMHFEYYFFLVAVRCQGIVPSVSCKHSVFYFQVNSISLTDTGPQALELVHFLYA